MRTRHLIIEICLSNRHRQGFSITCDAIPLAGRIVMGAITEPRVE